MEEAEMGEEAVEAEEAKGEGPKRTMSFISV